MELKNKKFLLRGLWFDLGRLDDFESAQDVFLKI